MADFEGMGFMSLKRECGKLGATPDQLSDLSDKAAALALAKALLTGGVVDSPGVGEAGGSGSCSPGDAAIVVLGGPLCRKRDNPDEEVPGPWLEQRLLVALTAYQQHQSASVPTKIILTGAACQSSISEAGSMARWMEAHGVPRPDLLLEEVSRTTVDNAWYSCKVLLKQPCKTLTVITSAFHMARARAFFDPMLEAFSAGAGFDLVESDSTEAVHYLEAPNDDGSGEWQPPCNDAEQEQAQVDIFQPQLQAAVQAARAAVGPDSFPEHFSPT